MDSALRSLSSERGSDSVSNFSFKSAHTQNTQTERINAMITESVNARKAKYYDLFENDMEPPIELDTSLSSSSDEQNYRRNRIHIDDNFNSIRGLKNESMLREMESERRRDEIAENNTRMFREELFRIHGETAIHNMQQQDIIGYYVNQFVQVPPPLPPPYSFSDKSQNRYFLKILYCNSIYEQLRCPNNQGNHLHQLQTMIQNHLMSQKHLLDDLETIMEYQQKHEKIPFISNFNQLNSLEHSYQTEDGEHLIFNILLKKGQLQND